MSIIAVKHLHICFVVLSVGLFIIRFLAREAQAQWSRRKFFKIAPHIIDTLLLASGIYLWLTIGYPLWPLNWLSVKLILVVAYIITGVIAMKAASKPKRRIAAILALTWILAIVHLALSKSI